MSIWGPNHETIIEEKKSIKPIDVQTLKTYPHQDRGRFEEEEEEEEEEVYCCKK